MSKPACKHLFNKPCPSKLMGSPDGEVASAHPLAIQAGKKILENGGNAFDATVAVASTLNVVEPMMSGIGGYGTMLIYNASEEKILHLNGCGKFPMKVNADLMRRPTENYMENRKGPMSISTPSNLNTWKEIHEKYGIIPWKNLFDNAILHAEGGVRVTKNAAKWIEESFTRFSAYAKSFYSKDSYPLKENDLLIQTDLAKTFKLIAEKGSEVFYRGEISVRIDEQMKKLKSFLSIEDLHKDTAEWGNIVKLNYEDYDIYTAGKPGNAFCTLLILGIMTQFPLKHFKHNSTEYLHVLAEIQKKSCEIRLMNLHDIDSINDILSENSFRSIANSIKMNAVSNYTLSTGGENFNTTHFVIVDKWRNVVSATQTLGNMFGSKVLIEGTGIWMNNSMVFSTFEPKGNPMDVIPGGSKVSSNSPVIIKKRGRIWAALGTPGGHTIPQNVAQIVLNLIVFKMDMQEAIDAPKIAFLEEENLMQAEDKISDKVINSLQKMGHQIKRGIIGNAMGIKMFYNKEKLFFNVGVDKRLDSQIIISNTSI